MINKQNTRLLPAVSAMLCGVMFAGCGGGGNGGSPAPAPTPAPTPIISSSNYEAHAKAFGSVFQASLTPMNALGTFGIGGPSQTPPQSAAALAPQISRLVSNVAQHTLARHALGGRATIQGTVSNTFNCSVSGTVNFTLTDADNNSMLSLGDSVSISATACKDDPQGPALNGSLSFKVNGLDFVVLAGGLEMNNFDFALTLTQFGNLGGASVTGSARLLAQGLSGTLPTQRLTYSNVTFTAPNVPSTVNNLDILLRTPITRTELEINGSYARNDTFSLRQLSPFIGFNTEYPTQGQLRVQDANGAAVLIKARSDQMVDVEFYPAGSTTASQVKTLSWVTLLGQ